jgi:transcription factor IIIB subunit 2
MIEFGETPSSLLSFEDFMAVDLEEEQDPPAYKEARRKDRERREQEKRALFVSILRKTYHKILENQNFVVK